jgi:hypothetical protein
MPASEYEDDEVEELYGVTEEIHEEDGRGVTNTVMMKDCNNVAGHKAFRNIAGLHGLGRKSQRGQMFINFFLNKWTCYQQNMV